jgi:hypothetical protein
MKHGAYDTDSLVDFLEAFHVHFAGEKVTLIWDGLPSHRSKAMTAWINKQRSWLVNASLPTPPTSIPSNCCGATSKASSWRNSAHRPSTRRGRPGIPPNREEVWFVGK